MKPVPPQDVLQLDFIVDYQDFADAGISHCALNERLSGWLQERPSSRSYRVPLASNLNVPPCSSTIRRQIASTRPAFPSGFVVKKDPKSFRGSQGQCLTVVGNSSATAAAPEPLSAARTVNWPPSGIASLALVKRLRKSCRNCWRSA